MNKENNRTIYVLCPYKTKTGGTELLHQLVYQLNKYNYNANIVYVSNNKIETNDVTPGFENYISKSLKINEIVDNKNNILVIPEVLIFNMRKSFKNIKKVIWWLSVDNFNKNNGFINHLKFWGGLKTISHTIKRLYKIIPIKNISDLGDLHLYQSYYAKNFLIKSGVKEKKMEYLSDYINDIYFERNNLKKIREDLVLYNPKKGYSFTKKLIDAAPEINWIPLINLTTNEVQELLARGKVYVDFGNHPGKDRFPREAAISGCCVITNKKGSASYYEDVMIKEKFKFEDSDTNIQLIINQIRSCLLNYEKCIEDYKEYNDFIKNEKSKFKEDLIRVFGYI